MNTVKIFQNSWSLMLRYKALWIFGVILVDRMWEKLPPDHPAVYREPGMVKLEVGITEEILEVSHV